MQNSIGIIEMATIIAFIVLFIHSTTWDGMINEWVKRVIKPEGMLYKPIYGCPICMTPYWGSLIIFVSADIFNLTSFLLTLGVASGISVIFVCFLAMRDYFVEATKKLEKENGK